MPPPAELASYPLLAPPASAGDKPQVGRVPKRISRSKSSGWLKLRANNKFRKRKSPKGPDATDAAEAIISPWLKFVTPEGTPVPFTPSSPARRNQVFSRDFDSTLGYPGEGPAHRGTREANRHDWKLVRRHLFQKALGRRTQPERRKERAGIQLRQAGLAPLTVHHYRSAFARFWSWLQMDPPFRVVDPISYDVSLSAFLEALWTAGETRNVAGNALSASLIVFPELKHKLCESWALLSIWNKIELPTRAPPLSPAVVLALANKFRLQGDWPGALLIVLGFDAFLRTGELMNAIWSDLSFNDDGTQGVINLWHTKTGQRSAAYEALPIHDPLVYRVYIQAWSTVAPGTTRRHYVYPHRPLIFRERFSAALRELGVAQIGYRPYSLRRGGATAFYRATANLQATIERGRWATARVARIYICDGLGLESELDIPAPVAQHVDAHASNFLTVRLAN